MKNTAIMSAAMALTLSLGNLALAQNNTGPDERRGGEQVLRRAQDWQQRNATGPQSRGIPNSSQPRNLERDNRQDNQWHGYKEDGDRSVPAGHRVYRQGERLAPAYRQKSYVVNDWRSHQLSHPARGYNWVQNGGDYLLIAIGTGIIVQVVQSRQA